MDAPASPSPPISLAAFRRARRKKIPQKMVPGVCMTLALPLPAAELLIHTLESSADILHVDHLPLAKLLVHLKGSLLESAEPVCGSEGKAIVVGDFVHG